MKLKTIQRCLEDIEQDYSKRQYKDNFELEFNLQRAKVFRSAIRAIDNLKAKNAALVAMLRDLEWQRDYNIGEWACPICGNTQEQGHAESCELSKLIAAQGGEGMG